MNKDILLASKYAECVLKNKDKKRLNIPLKGWIAYCNICETQLKHTLKRIACLLLLSKHNHNVVSVTTNVLIYGK